MSPNWFFLFISRLGKPCYWVVLRCYAILYELFNSERLRVIDSYERTFLKTRLHFLQNLQKRKRKQRIVIVYSRKNHASIHAIARRWLYALLFIIPATLIVIIGVKSYEYIFFQLPTPDDLRRHTPHLTTKIFDRNGVLLYSMFRDENRTLVDITTLPTHVVAATVSIEDKDFYTHKGVSLTGITRAFYSIITGKGIQGGSTITQQLIKTTLLTPERTISRKLKEAIIALRVERHFSKQEILQMYVNEVSYGGSLYGIEAAAQGYFHTAAKDLSLAQAAFLAGLPAAPSQYNPFGSHPELGKERQLEVLRRMREDGKISEQEMEAAKNESLLFAKNTQPIIAPHFVMYVREQLAKEYGEDMLEHGGLQVTTTLDATTQEQVQSIVSKEVASLTKLRVGNGAAMVTNPKTGEILAMVGSVDFFDISRDGQVNVTIRQRQPGSSIKPVTYTVALERGFTPSTLIEDSPVVYTVPGSAPYIPKNYDGRFHGKVTVRTALAASYNIPAVKTEVAVGLPAVIEKGKKLGITTWEDSSRYGLSLTLGGAEVKMIDMAVVYGTFANLGVTVPTQSILQITNSEGREIFQNPCRDTLLPCGGHRTLDPRIAYQITNILTDNSARAPAFGTRSVLFIPDQEVAVKTGTTNLLRDNWTNGYTSNRVVLVWVGNNNNSPMSQITSGVIGASPIWNKIIRLTLKDLPRHVFPVPSNLFASSLCRQTGNKDCGNCTNSNYVEYFLPGTQPTVCTQDSPDPSSNPLTKQMPPTIDRR